MWFCSVFPRAKRWRGSPAKTEIDVHQLPSWRQGDTINTLRPWKGGWTECTVLDDSTEWLCTTNASYDRTANNTFMSCSSSVSQRLPCSVPLLSPLLHNDRLQLWFYCVSHWLRTTTAKSTPCPASSHLLLELYYGALPLSLLSTITTFYFTNVLLLASSY